MTSPVGGHNNIEPTTLHRSSQVVTSRPKGSAFQRSVSAESDVKPSIPSATKDPSAAGSSLLSRSVSATSVPDAYLTPTPDYPDVLTPEQFTHEAGDPGKGPLSSQTFKGVISALKDYHKTASAPLGEQLSALNNLQDKAESFLEKKAGEAQETVGKGGLSEKKAKRLKGTNTLLATVYNKQSELGEKAIKEAISAKRADKHEKVSQLFDNQSIPDIATTIKGLPAAEQKDALSDLIASYDSANMENRNLPTALMLEVIKQEGGTPEAVQNNRSLLLTAMSMGSVSQCAENVHMVHKAGMLDIDMLSAVGQRQIVQIQQAYTADDPKVFAEMMPNEPTTFEALMAGIDLSFLGGFFSLNIYLSLGGVIVSPLDIVASVAKLPIFAAECFLVFMDRLLTQEGADPALKLMAESCDNLCMRDMEAYNKNLPRDDKGELLNEKQLLDVNKEAFQAEFSKLDSQYFARVANGESIDPESMGWKSLGENWQQAPGAEKHSREAVISDFFYHNAPGVKH